MAIAETLSEKKEFEESNNYYLEALQLAPALIDRSSLYIGENYFGLEEYDKAIQYLSQAEKLFSYQKNIPASVRALRTLASCYEITEEWKAALLVLKKRLEMVQKKLHSIFFF